MTRTVIPLDPRLLAPGATPEERKLGIDLLQQIIDETARILREDNDAAWQEKARREYDERMEAEARAQGSYDEDEPDQYNRYGGTD